MKARDHVTPGAGDLCQPASLMSAEFVHSCDFGCEVARFVSKGLGLTQAPTLLATNTCNLVVQDGMEDVCPGFGERRGPLYLSPCRSGFFATAWCRFPARCPTRVSVSPSLGGDRWPGAGCAVQTEVHFILAFL